MQAQEREKGASYQLPYHPQFVSGFSREIKISLVYCLLYFASMASHHSAANTTPPPSA